MTLILYTMPSCKICNARQQDHNELHRQMQERGIDMEGITYGMYNGQTFNPRKEHDQMCRKKDNKSLYTAPVYILETEDSLIQLPDMGKFKSIAEYADAVQSILDEAEGDIEQ